MSTLEDRSWDADQERRMPPENVDTRDVRIVTVSQLKPGDVVVTWEDDGFPWTGVVVESYPDHRPTMGQPERVQTVVYEHGQTLYNQPRDKQVKIQNREESDR